ncbi:TPA: hypothetical protein L9A94_002958, partial [Klebsiella pneumoniae]|nr:hypothetical protein [Klebsiella pneumoniae]
MTRLPESSSWEEEIELISRSERVAGGMDGPANRPLKSLANRTRYLKDQVDIADESIAEKVSAIKTFAEGATLESPREEILFSSYRLVWTGEFPKKVPVASTPETTGGVGAGRWAYTSDAAIRANLASGDEGMGASLVAMLGRGTVASTLAFAVTPEMFGAVGDGRHDDTHAIIAAIDYCLANGINELRGRGIYLITDSIGCKSNYSSSNPLLHFRIELAVVVIDDQWDALPDDWWNAKPAFYSAGNSASDSASLENFELVVHAFYGNWRAHFFEVKGGGMSTSRICCSDPRNYIIGYKCIGPAAAQSTMNRVVGRLWQSGYVGVLIGGRWNGTGSGNTECHVIEVQWFATNRYGGIVTSDAARFVNILTGTYDYNGKYSSMLSLTGLSTGDGP